MCWIAEEQCRENDKLLETEDNIKIVIISVIIRIFF